MLTRYTFCLYVANNIGNRVAQVIKLNQSSDRGGEQGHVVSDGTRLHDEAVDAFVTMLLKLKRTSDGECLPGEPWLAITRGIRLVDTRDRTALPIV